MMVALSFKSPPRWTASITSASSPSNLLGCSRSNRVVIASGWENGFSMTRRSGAIEPRRFPLNAVCHEPAGRESFPLCIGQAPLWLFEVRGHVYPRSVDPARRRKDRSALATSTPGDPRPCAGGPPPTGNRPRPSNLAHLGRFGLLPFGRTQMYQAFRRPAPRGTGLSVDLPRPCPLRFRFP